MNSSISRRLIFWLAVPLMLLALCGGLIHYFNHVAPGVISSDRRLKDAANALMAHASVKQGQVFLDLNPYVKPFLPPADTIKFVLRDADGRLLAGEAQLPPVILGSDGTELLAMAQLDGRSVRTLTTRFNTAAGPAILTVADMRKTSEPEARLGLMNTLLWDFVQLDITLVLVWVGIQLGLRPIRRLRDEIASRSPLDLRPMAESSVPREIAPLVVTLNSLFARLRTSVQSQQQFIADTAHQLRTPITGMQAQLGLLAAEPAARPVKERLLTLQEGVKQLAHSANQLLSLARADPAANINARNQTLDLQTIVNEVAAKFFDRALQANIDLGVETTPAIIRADPSLLDDLMSNLVDNALKYTPGGGRVTASAGEKNGRPFLAVVDTGVGIPESERQRVRQRFYRMPNSPGHGSGLGLAIVDEIARLYEGSMTIESGTDGAGTRVLIQFPPRAVN